MVNIGEYFISQQTLLYVLQSHSMGSWSQTIHCTAVIVHVPMQYRIQTLRKGGRGEGGSSRPLHKGGPPKFFSALQFGLKIREGPLPPPPGPSFGSATHVDGDKQPFCWRGGSVLWTIFIKIKKIII